MRYALNGSPALSELGDELLVCDAEGQQVHRLSGAGRDRFEQVAAEGLVDLESDEVTAALEAAGLIVPVGEPTDNVVGMSRRRALAVGAAAAAAGVVTVALPKAAAAQSEGPGPAPSSTTTTTAPAPGPSGATTGVEIYEGANSIGIRWRQGSYPNPFSYSYVITLEGVTVFSGTLDSVVGMTYTYIGDLGAGGGRPYSVTFTSITTPVTTVTRSGTTGDF